MSSLLMPAGIQNGVLS